MSRNRSLKAVLIVAGGLTLVVSGLAVRQRFQLSVASLERELGPKRYSQENEELLIRHFFKDRKFGTFVDVGSGHYLRGNNTFYLEEQLAWRGIAIDANGTYADGYAQHRPRTQFITALVSNSSDQDADFFLVPNLPTLSSGVASAVKGLPHVIPTKVKTATLNDLLRSNSLTRFDFLSLDIELGEPKALAGLDIRTFHPALVCVEAHEQVRDAIAVYFNANGYRRLDDYLSVDDRNWYYTPR
jgi:hypothetical protein